MISKKEILQFSGLPNFRYPNNVVNSDKEIFDFYLTQKIPQMEVRILTNVLASPYGILYKNCSVLKECTPYYFDPKNEYLPKFMERYINSGGKLFGGSVERLIRHFVIFKRIRIKHFYSWCSDHYSPFYMHWLVETLPRIYLFSLLDFDNPTVVLPGPTLKNVSFVSQSLNLFFPNIEFLFTENKTVLEFKELFWISQMGKPSLQFNPPLMKSFRSFIRSKITSKLETPSVWRRLYVSRRNATCRKVLNESEIEPILRMFGFEIVCFEDYSFEKQIEMCSQSRIIIGIHGAGLANMIFMPENSFVVELQRRLPWSTCFYSLANALDFNYYYLFCDHESEEVDGRLDNVNLSVDLSALKSLLVDMVNTYESK